MGKDKVRIGFVGTGGIGKNHIAALEKLEAAELVAMCDLNGDAARTAAGPFGAAVYTEAGQLLAEARLDALYVCVPPFAHGDIEIVAARKGIHLFVEKPVNLFMDQALEVANAIEKAGVISQAGYGMRYQKSTAQLKAFLEDKQVGTAHVLRWSGVVRNAWWPDYAKSGGQLAEMTTHQVDLLRYVMGEARAVSACYSFDRLLKDEQGVTVPDSQAAVIHFESGASATVNTSCALQRGYKGEMVFVVKDAVVTLSKEGIALEPAGAYPIPPMPADTAGIDESFVNAIRGGDRSLTRSPYADAMRSAAVVLGANRSAEDGGRLVTLSEMLGT